MKRKKIISVDLDGVLNLYNGVYDKEVIPPIKPGAIDFIKKLFENFRIVIHTTRNTELVIKWLNANGLMQYIHDVSNIKNPFSSIFLDDRALNFDGDFEKAYKKIINFNPYWKK